ncbi:MAG: ABC transporter ATP-binding protein [Anaerolineae bacterium]
MITTRRITKRYGDVVALDRLSLEVPAGTVFGLLGPNGAGKTTLLRLVMGFIFPDAGTLERGGLSPTRIGYLPERAFYPPRVTIIDYLTTIGRLAGRRIAYGPATSPKGLLAALGLQQAAGRRLGACSRGMLQRVGLAQALMADPPLLLLDEPALGLDPAGQKFMREQILTLQQAGKTVLLSSHHLDEVIRVCSHVAVINEGRLVQCGPLETILAPRAQVTIRSSPLAPELASELAALGPGVTVVAGARPPATMGGAHQAGGSGAGEVKLTGEAVAHKALVLRRMLDAGVDVRHLYEQHATLEEIYLEATGQ